MKRLLQSVALALATLIAVQPALATMTCAHMVCADGHSSPDCCLPSSGASMPGMDMSAMSASGQAPSQASASDADCFTAPGCTVSVRPATLPAAAVKSRFSGAVAFTRLPGSVVAMARISAASPAASADPSPPDRHILFQVFRI